VLLDYAAYLQGDVAFRLMPLTDTGAVRDLRVFASGRFFQSRFEYTASIAYDTANDTLLVRQTGGIVRVPELNGYLFLGRTKEGFSTNKFMTGYYGWTMERSTSNDAFIPILADGIRWIAAPFHGRLVYNVGAYADAFSENESFNKNDWQIAGRAVWLPWATADPGADILHLAAEVRVAGPENGSFQYRSKPESFEAQSQAIDTGMFEGDLSTMLGLEAYYRHGPFLIGSEYFINFVKSTPAHDPIFHGGEVVAAYIFTGEKRPYNGKTALFTGLVPFKTVYQGGPGAFEGILRLSYSDLDSGTIEGGRFIRITPGISWWWTRAIRYELNYGYGVVERNDARGGTQFFQLRAQITFE
jgi:phosphate-selective porin OprO/OprP